MRLLSVFLYFVLTFYNTVACAQIQITDMRLWQQTDSETLRLVLDLNAPVVHKIFTLKSPYRVVIDLKNTGKFRRSVQVPSEQTLLTNIRSAPRDGNDLRIVLDLSAPVSKKSFLLKPSGDNGHRLVIDIKGPGLKKSKPLLPKLPLQLPLAQKKNR
jgi:N-acetylmuramoyl-L-alanine amidase